MGRAGTAQIHDYEPGITADGLFWTIPVPASALGADLDRGTASYAMQDLAMPDFHDTANSLAQGPSEPATVTFRVDWLPGHASRRFEQVDATNGFRGEYTEGVSLIQWSAKQEGFEFVSDPSTPEQSMFSIVGHERNGRFFDTPASAPASGDAPPPTQAPPTQGPRLPATGRGNDLFHLGGGALLLGEVARRIARRYNGSGGEMEAGDGGY